MGEGTECTQDPFGCDPLEQTEAPAASPNQLWRFGERGQDQSPPGQKGRSVSRERGQAGGDASAAAPIPWNTRLGGRLLPKTPYFQGVENRAGFGDPEKERRD